MWTIQALGPTYATCDACGARVIRPGPFPDVDTKLIREELEALGKAGWYLESQGGLMLCPTCAKVREFESVLIGTIEDVRNPTYQDPFWDNLYSSWANLKSHLKDVGRAAK